MATTKPVTADDLIGVADGYRYDLIRGELYRMSAAGGGGPRRSGGCVFLASGLRRVLVAAGQDVYRGHRLYFAARP